MSDISDLSPDGLPSSKRLLRATVTAVLAASALLLIAVLPAEFGIDPTGLGHKLGLTALNTAEVAESDTAIPQPEPAVAALWKGQSDYRNDEMALPLMPGQGAEIKAVMQAGENFVFHWSVEGGSVSFDMHGERPNAANGEFTSYWLGQAQSSASGTFHAPFAGTHGFYWQNDGQEPVIVRLKTSGFYETLFMP